MSLSGRGAGRAVHDEAGRPHPLSGMRTPGRTSRVSQFIASTPVRARPMISFCTWLVPS
ncbi:hypothetical protein EES47_16135 [Streptomyces sp. ADI98-12]|uniref:Uncharacterized protein n=1 Tax=Streptomyces griseus TaxID=1911 RepID=A0A380P546_STRGR|nr:hypothetical protein [Streptomyces sp. DSM 41037]RPK87887.1 hypothetical protein EES47_16135 [Streptomyces sp. ADI98-12]SUP60343.1 Uncharacterised protein [Streptomyces griseus]